MNRRFGADLTLDDLRRAGFAAVFLGIGAQAAVSTPIVGAEQADAVWQGIDFLQRVNRGDRSKPGDRVAVVGGGNVAVDAARTARRLGAAHVSILYRRSAAEMPAYEEEIAAAREEGIEFIYLCTPVEVRTRDGRICDLICLHNELGPPDGSGRRRPVPVAGSNFSLACDALIPAVGQKVESAWAAGLPELVWTRRGTVQVDPQTGQTSMADVFAAGDAVTGPATAIEAVSAAHRAAAAIAALVDGLDPAGAAAATAMPPPGDDWAPIPRVTAQVPRARAARLPAAERRHDFREVERTLCESDARREAGKCLNCGVCSECMACVTACEANAIDHHMQAEEVEVKVGSIILASGYDTLDPARIVPLGYGRFANVFTALEFERLSNATGPTGGNILMRDGIGGFGQPPRGVALVHCVGSRDTHYHEYCSRVCCMYALKYTHLIKEKVGHDTAVYDFYIDMRCFGKGYEEFYRRCQEEGTIFVRGKVAEISDQAQTPEEAGRLTVIAEDTLLGERIRVAVDMVVLCTAIEARRDAAALGRIFGVNLGADGFFLEEHPKLGPLNTAMDGIFLAGCCQKPMDIPDTVSQASGAAAKSLSLASRGKVAVPPTISFIDPDICIGCRMCLELCAYGAIHFNERIGISEINPAVCKGCGSCSAHCPSGAAVSRHFTKTQMFAEIDGIFETIAPAGVAHDRF